MAGTPVNEILGSGNLPKRNAPVGSPGRLLSAHRKEVVAMKQLRLNVAITVDYRFALAVAFGVVSLTTIVLLLKQ